MAVEAQFALLGSQNWMDNGCGGGLNHSYCSYLQHQQCNLQLLQNYQFKNQNHGFQDHSINSIGVPQSYPLKVPSMLYSQSMAAYDDKQSQEVDRYIRLQNERLRLLLQEQRKQHLASLMKGIETKAVPLLKQKEEEIAQAAKRTRELEDTLKRLERENQAWQRVAKENEAMVMSLNNTIEQLRGETASCCCDNDAVSCDVNREEERSRGFSMDGTKKMMMVCRGCNSGNSCILFLPCRHLCSCKACEAFLDSCPVCQTVKKASIEALI